MTYSVRDEGFCTLCCLFREGGCVFIDEAVRGVWGLVREVSRTMCVCMCVCIFSLSLYLLRS